MYSRLSLLGGCARSPEQSSEQGNPPSSKQKEQVNIFGGMVGEISGSAESSWERLGWSRAHGCSGDVWGGRGAGDNASSRGHGRWMGTAPVSELWLLGVFLPLLSLGYHVKTSVSCSSDLPTFDI